MSDLKRTLYAFHGRPSSNTIKTAILLEELGLGYEISSLSVCHPTYENDAVALTLCFQRDNGDQKSAEHTKRHPNSKVPVLHNVNRVMTWESLAISLHLIKEYDKNLLFSRYRIDTLVYLFMTDIKLHSNNKQEMADIIAWYSLQATALSVNCFPHIFVTFADDS
jgi:glutathione S-transferase